MCEAFPIGIFSNVAPPKHLTKIFRHGLFDALLIAGSLFCRLQIP